MRSKGVGPASSFYGWSPHVPALLGIISVLPAPKHLGINSYLGQGACVGGEGGRHYGCVTMTGLCPEPFEATLPAGSVLWPRLQPLLKKTYPLSKSKDARDSCSSSCAPTMCNTQLPGHQGDVDEYEVCLTLGWLQPERRQGEPSS